MKRAAEPRPERQRGDHPFPWPCFACLEGQVRPVVMPYTAEVRHDGVLHSVHLPQFEVPKCQACGELVFSNHADEQISNALRAKLRLSRRSKSEPLESSLAWSKRSWPRVWASRKKRFLVGKRAR